MASALYLLRAYWKPLAVLAVMAFLWHSGYRAAERACDAANLKAENAWLQRQSAASATVLEKAGLEREANEIEINNLTQKVEDYERSIDQDDGCILSGDDASRLRNIR